jgi:hypothetical protein
MSPLRSLSPISQRVIGVVILFLVVMTVTSTLYYSHEQRAISNCQTEFNVQFIKQLKARNDIATSDRNSIAELIQKILTVNSREERRKALQDYVKTKEENDAKRAQHPLPTLPEESARC